MERSWRHFENVDQIRNTIGWVNRHPLFGRQPIGNLYNVAKSSILQKLSQSHLDHLRDFDWIDYAISQEAGDDVETVYQTLIHLAEDLPSGIVQKLERAYEALTFGRDVEQIKCTPLQQATLFMKLFDEQAKALSYTIEKKAHSWQEWKCSYTVRADYSGEVGLSTLVSLRDEWGKKYGHKISCGDIELQPDSNTASFIVEPWDVFEEDFDQLCSLSIMRRNKGLLESVRSAAFLETEGLGRPADTNKTKSAVVAPSLIL